MASKFEFAFPGKIDASTLPKLVKAIEKVQTGAGDKPVEDVVINKITIK